MTAAWIGLTLTVAFALEACSWDWDGLDRKASPIEPSDASTDGAPGASSAPAVVGFSLIDADTDAPIAAFDPLVDGATLDLSRLPRNLNIRVNTSPDHVGSVRIELDGIARLEDNPPYSLGNAGTDFLPQPLSVGAHRLRATPFTGADAGGTAGVPKEIAFVVVSGA